MKRFLSRFGTGLVILVIGLLAIAVALYLRDRSLGVPTVVSPLLSPQTGQSVATDATSLATASTVAPVLSTAFPVDEMASSAIPECDLELRPTLLQTDRSPIAYVLSAPAVVLTRTTAVAVAQWSTDSREVIVALGIPGRSFEELATLDVSTGAIETYAERRRVGTKPAWSSGALVYGDRLDDGRSVIRMAGADGNLALLSESAADPSVVARSGGDEVGLMLASAAPTLRVIRSGAIEGDRTMATHALPGASAVSGGLPGRLLAWQPESLHILLAGSGEALLVDAGSGAMCRIALVEAAVDGAENPAIVIDATWSPDGRYLAMLVVRGDIPSAGSTLVLIDGADGTLREIAPPAILPDSPAFVMDVAWSPDSVTLAMRSTVAQRDGVLRDGLYLVDASTGEASRVLADVDFAGGDAGWNLSWAPNGKWLALACPTETEGRVCLVSVTAEQ